MIHLSYTSAKKIGNEVGIGEKVVEMSLRALDAQGRIEWSPKPAEFEIAFGPQLGYQPQK